MELKSFCQNHADHKLLKDLVLCDAEWESVHELVTILSPFNKCSKRLQSVELSLSDFFGIWTSLRIKLAKRSDEFSGIVIDQMNKYHTVLMDNPLIVASIYLDPRYQRSLTADKKDLARKVLVDLYVRLRRIETFEISEENTIQTEQTDAINCSDNSEEEIYAFLDACGSIDDSRQNPIQISNENDTQWLEEQLKKFDGITEPLSKSIFALWEQMKTAWPEIYTLASVILAIPPTQTTVERAFSALALVFTSHRTKLSDQSLQNILLVRLNYKIYEEEMDLKGFLSIAE